MKLRIPSWFGIGVLSFVPWAAIAAGPAARPNVGKVAIGYSSLDSQAKALAEAVRLGARIACNLPEIRAVVVRFPSDAAAERAMPRLAKIANVRYVEAVGLARASIEPNDPLWGNQWGARRIRVDRAWDHWQGDGTNFVAVLDTGFDYSHPDLANQAWGGYDFVNNDGHPADDNGHGTHVSGTIGALTNNALGVAGIGWGAHIAPVKVLDASGSGSYDWVAQGIVWVTTNSGVTVINMSLGGSSPSQLLLDAVNYAAGRGVVLCAAAGNDGSTSPEYPAAYGNCIAVAASTTSDERASFSNHGSGWVDVAAPGIGIFSTVRGGSYQSWNGTSMASPHVAALAGLLYSKMFGFSRNESYARYVRQVLETSCNRAGTYTTWGRIDAYAAIQETFRRAPGYATTIGQGTSQEVTNILDMAVTRAGEVVAVGTYGGPNMNARVTFLSSRGNPKWSYTFDEGGLNDWFQGVALDRQGNVVVVGRSDTATGTWLHLLKFTPRGQLLWHYRSDFQAAGLDVAVDSRDRIFVCGAIEASGAMRSGILSFNPDGTLRFATSFPEHPAGSRFLSLDVADGDSRVTAAGDVYVWQGGQLGCVHAGTGAKLWASSYNVSTLAVAQGLVRLASGHYVVAGHSGTTNGSADAVAIWIDSATGAEIRRRVFNGSAGGNDFYFALTRLSSGDIVAVGETASSGVGREAMIHRLSAATGNLSADRRYCAPGTWQGGLTTGAESVAIAPNGDVYVTGGGYSHTDCDAFLLRFDANLNESLWQTKWDRTGSRYESGWVVRVDRFGNPILGVQFGNDATGWSAAVVRYTFSEPPPLPVGAGEPGNLE